MCVLGLIFMYIAIKKKVEPMLLFPLGLGILICNVSDNSSYELFSFLYKVGLGDNELFPLLLFIGIGTMLDLSYLLSNPKLVIFGLLSQSGVLVSVLLARLLGFSIVDSLSIGAIGTADGPTSLIVSKTLGSSYSSTITVLAYSYVALVPLLQPLIINLLTTKEERGMKSIYKRTLNVSKKSKVILPIAISVIVSILSPKSSSLVVMLMFGNLLRELELKNLCEVAQNTLTNLISLFLGLSLSSSMIGENVISLDTLKVLGIGLVAFTVNISTGILSVKLHNLFTKNKINPMVGGAGISAFPMASRTIQKEGLKYNKQNHLLTEALTVNISGQLFSAVVGGLLLSL